MTVIADPHPDTHLCRLDKRVALCEPDENTVILAGGRLERVLRLTGTGAQLARALRQPSRFDELLPLLAAAYPFHPPAAHQQALRQLLDKFAEAGFLQASGSETAQKSLYSRLRWRLPNPDKTAAVLARGLAGLPGLLRYLLFDAAVLFSLVTLSFSWPELRPMATLRQISPAVALLVGILLCGWLLLHELSHAVACRFHGYPVAGAGLLFRGFLLPSAYINTSAIQFTSRRKVHIQVALAGPFTDLYCAAAACFAMRHLQGTASQVAEYVAVIILAGLLFNLTPFRASDGRSAFHAWHFLSGRAAAPGENRRVTLLYGGYALAYLSIVTCFFLHVAGFTLL